MNMNVPIDSGEIAVDVGFSQFTVSFDVPNDCEDARTNTKSSAGHSRNLNLVHLQAHIVAGTV